MADVGLVHGQSGFASDGPPPILARISLPGAKSCAIHPAVAEFHSFFFKGQTVVRDFSLRGPRWFFAPGAALLVVARE
jgi:hypothetical protein